MLGATEHKSLYGPDQKWVKQNIFKKNKWTNTIAKNFLWEQLILKNRIDMSLNLVDTDKKLSIKL